MTLAFKSAPFSQQPNNMHTDAQDSSAEGASRGHNYGSNASPNERDLAASNNDDEADESASGDAHAAPDDREVHSSASIVSPIEEHNEKGDTSEQARLHTDAVTMLGEEGGYAFVQEARRPSISDISGSMSDASEFDVADDDDDYAAIDQLSQASENDANIEELDTHHLATNVNDWTNTAQEPSTPQDDLSMGVNWDDQRTYDFEYSFPYSDSFPLDALMADALTMDPLHQHGEHIPSIETSMSTRTSAAMPFDPHMGPALFPEDMSTSDESSITSDKSKKTTKRHHLGTADMASSNAEAQPIDDTDSEDLTEEIEQRRRSAELKRKKKRNQTKQKHRSSHKKSSSSVSTHASKIQKFTRTPRKIHATPRMTSRGRIICLSVTDRTKIRWITGRVPVDPTATAPSPELTRHLRSRMFQQAYCPDPSAAEKIGELSMSALPWDHAMLNQPIQGGSRFVMPYDRSGTLESMLDAADGDFSNFIDDDGEPGITIAEQFIVPSDDWMDGDNSQGSWRDPGFQLEDDDMLDEPPASARIIGQPNLDENDAQRTPCPKRQRTTKQDVGHEQHSEDEAFLNQPDSFPAPSTAPHHIPV